MIVTGELAPGGRLNERVLCEILQVSRTPLREAYKILAKEGLISLLPNRGAIVTRMSRQETADTVHVIANLEAMAGELFVKLSTDEEIRHVVDLTDRLVTFHKKGNLIEYYKTNHEIHSAILKASRNKCLIEMWNSLTARVMRFRFGSNASKERWDEAVQEHQMMVPAIQGRIGPVLREMLKFHLYRGWEAASIRLELDD
jgi:DNA-binding GntR family transcriptional regulator